MEKSETLRILSMLKAVWSNEEITPEKIEVYHLVLADYPFEQIAAAARVHIGRSTFFPKPAELLAIVATAAVPEISGGDAWRIVTRQIGLHGYDGRARCDFGNPVIEAAVDQVGWRRICLESDPKGYIQRDFEKALIAAQERLRREVQSGAALAQVAGGADVVQLPRRAS